MKKILHLLKDNKAFNALLNKQNIVVNSSNSEALLIASAFLTLKKDMLIVKSNQYEANLLYKQVSQMMRKGYCSADARPLFFEKEKVYCKLTVRFHRQNLWLHVSLGAVRNCCRGAPRNSISLSVSFA